MAGLLQRYLGPRYFGEMFSVGNQMHYHLVDPSLLLGEQVEAFEESQKYKEGKCIIEKAKMADDSSNSIEAGEY